MAIRLLFHINRRGVGETGKMQGDFRRAAFQVIGDQVLLRFGKGQQKRIKDLVNTQFRKDVDAEINHAAAQYGRYALGSSRIQGPQSGTQTSLFDSQVSEETGGRRGGWTPRRDDYLKRKRKEYGHIKWFIRSGHTQKSLSGKGVWQNIWGGTRVRVIIDSKLDSDAKAFGTAGRGVMHTTLATIKVGALPGLAGQFKNVGAKLRAYDNELANRVLGRRKNRRPTLEPFLEFVVNRAVPAGVQKRLEAGLRGSIYRKR